MKDEVKTLWKQSFNDSSEFIDLYFKERYSDDINMAIMVGKKVISALQMIPYPMTFSGSNIPTSYISGACTHPDYRNQGTMKALLEQTLNRMYNDGILLGTLIPAEEWLFGYYRKFGYETTFSFSIEQPDVTDYPVNSIYLTEAAFSINEEIFAFFDRKMKERPCCIQHSLEDLRVIFADLQLSGGKLFIVRNTAETTLVGMAFCYPENGSIVFKELFADNIMIKNILLHEATTQLECEQIRIITPPVDENVYELGMGRIINVESMLQLYIFQHPNIRLNIRVSDNIIKENEGYFHIAGGIMKRSSFPKEGIKYREININELTLLLMGQKTIYGFESQKPYMSLMLN